MDKKTKKKHSLAKKETKKTEESAKEQNKEPKKDDKISFTPKVNPKSSQKYHSDIRDNIIKVLAKYNNLRAKQIYRLLNTKVSYQAVFKMIKTMIDEKIIDQENLSYKLNSGYINEMLKFVDELKFQDNNKYSQICDKLKDSHEIISLKFKKQIDLITFIFGFLDYCSTVYPGDYCLLHVSNLFGLFSLLPKSYESIKNISKNSKFFIVVKQDTKWNEAIVSLWRKLGINIKTGVNFGGKDCAVYRGVVLKIFIDDSKISELSELAKEVQRLSNVNVTEMIYNLYEKEIDFTLEISMDVKFSSSLKDRLLNWF